MTNAWSTAEIAFAAKMPGYESRPEQTRLATTIEAAFIDGAHLLAQAGTGCGKSFAGLIPGIATALATGNPIIVATATKALQNQYVGDLAFLASVLPTPFTSAILKGRSNYLCRAKFAELGEGDIEGVADIRKELEADPNHSGDLEGFIAPIDPRDRPRLASSADECPGRRDCIFGDVCFAELAKDRARESDVVVVNHSMLGMDLTVREMTRDPETGVSAASVLPIDISGVIIDEAHEFENYMTNALGAEVSTRSITALLAEIANFVPDRNLISGASAAGTRLFTDLERFRRNQRSVKLDSGALLAHQDQFINLIEALRTVKNTVKGVSSREDEKVGQKKKRLVKRVDAQIKRLEDLLMLSDNDLVRWIEEDVRAKGNGPKGALIKYAPLHVGPFLRRNLWEETPAVLLSATLSVGKDFSFITERLGLQSPRSFDAGTPFDYRNQARIFVPEGFDPKNTAKWRAQVAIAVPELIAAAGGRSLVLFTSRSAMDEAHESLVLKLEDMGLTVLKQGDKPNPELSRIFKDDETSVLFALKSFMTGFDVQGDALRLVIIDKLPYENPSDVIWSARCDLVDRKARNKWTDGAFTKMTIPAMLLTLQQGIGRLIRSKSDEGMVAILDSRIYDPKGYTKTIRAALPPAPVVRTLPLATGYLAELTSRRG